MESYLLDTDIVIYWLNNEYPEIERKIQEVTDEALFISSITAAELYFGAYNSTRKDENIAMIDELVQEINVIDFNQKTGKFFGEIKANLKNRGEIICDSDIFIAATAISNDLTLITNNEKHFSRIEKLKCENWTKKLLLRKGEKGDKEKKETGQITP